MNKGENDIYCAAGSHFVPEEDWHPQNMCIECYIAANEEMQRAKENMKRMVHSLLQQYSELLGEDLSNHHVYGSPMRPMSSAWARIPNAVFMQTNRQETGYHTFVAVPTPLESSEVNRYELTSL